ncbi:MAG: hypothetical protein ABI346_07160 [Candidatus Baltobacteraceae bacterium]
MAALPHSAVSGPTKGGALLAMAFVLAMAPTPAATATQPWLTLPPTPTLPKADVSGLAPVNGVKIWYA